MPLELADHEKLARKAVRHFWMSRASASTRQQANGKSEQGERAAVTAGKNMDGFLDMVAAIVKANGLAHADIHRERRLLTLPGYFRPTKLWDMLVINEGRLVAAIEFKSHVGPSFGNNFNNRTEEALGTATDLWTAYREGALGAIAKPFVGWLMLLEDCPQSRSPVQDKSPHFPVFPEFRGASYARRYDILCQRLMREQLYTAASVLTSPRTGEKSGAFAELAGMTGLRTFVTTLAGHVAAEAARSR